MHWVDFEEAVQNGAIANCQGTARHGRGGESARRVDMCVWTLTQFFFFYLSVRNCKELPTYRTFSFFFVGMIAFIVKMRCITKFKARSIQLFSGGCRPVWASETKVVCELCGTKNKIRVRVHKVKRSYKNGWEKKKEVRSEDYNKNELLFSLLPPSLLSFLSYPA